MSASQPQNVAITVSREGEYQLTFEPHHGRVKAMFAGKAIADSQATMVLREGNLPPVYYFPRQDVRMDLLEPTDRVSHCPFRGYPLYFDIRSGDRIAANAAWSYQEPYPESDYVKDYVAFFGDEIDGFVEEEPIETRAQADYSTNPLIDWLVQHAWQANSIMDLVTRWLEMLKRSGISLVRFALITRTLHPQLSGAAYRWEKGDEMITQRLLVHEMLETSQYLDSPLVPIFEGAGGIRRRLGKDPSTDEFPVFADIREAGGTDYVAMPLTFSDGQINAITMATDREDGFATEQLAQINEALPLFARLVEVFAQREKSETLLTTYLGEQSGKRVLDGLVRRGDGSDIHSVIWFCDLRDSGGLAASMSRDDFLKHLNAFFDSVVGAVLDNGGEVLRFIGDAALAIFPFTPEQDHSKTTACQRAMDAARDARDRVAAFNKEHAGEGGEYKAIRFGIGLHIGDVTYGNIGTSNRLEFTVVGAAANEASRIEGLCKVLGSPVLVSQDFVEYCPQEYRSMGRHVLRGTAREVELFAPAWCNRAGKMRDQDALSE